MPTGRASCLVLSLIFLTPMLLSGCHATVTNKQQPFFTSGSRKANQRAAQYMAQQEQLAGSGEGAGEKEGFRDYGEMCVSSYGTPGVAVGEIAKGLCPLAPNLAKTVPDWTLAQLFWITKEGVKVWGIVPSATDGASHFRLSVSKSSPESGFSR